MPKLKAPPLKVSFMKLLVTGSIFFRKKKNVAFHMKGKEVNYIQLFFYQLY